MCACVCACFGDHAWQALPASLELIRSPLLQGGALDQLKLFLTALAASGQPGATTDELMSQLLATGRGVGSQARGTPLAVAQCVAVLARYSDVASRHTHTLTDAMAWLNGNVHKKIHVYMHDLTVPLRLHMSGWQLDGVCVCVCVCVKVEVYMYGLSVLLRLHVSECLISAILVCVCVCVCVCACVSHTQCCWPVQGRRHRQGTAR